jgi:hypothetical protein
MVLTEYRDRHLTSVEGFLESTLPAAFDLESIALLNVDVDLYESHKVCLQTFGPRVGGIVVYDEYADPKWPGATLAINEALAASGHELFYSELCRRDFSLPLRRVNDRFGLEIQSALRGIRRSTPIDEAARPSAELGALR